MIALRLRTFGDPGSLVLERIGVPEPGSGEVLVRVVAAAITRDELDWPEDRLPATPSYEFSGVVAALGPGIVDRAPGEEVYALSGFDRDGAAAEYVVLADHHVAPSPKRLSHFERAAVPLAALSAWQGLFDHGRLTSGQRVLVHGVGGVGAFAVQLAKARGAEVIATTSADNVDTARELGADQVVEPGDFQNVVDRVDLVFDTAGGERLERSPAVVRPGGRIVSIATDPPSDPPIESSYFVVEPSGAQLTEITALIDAGELRVASVDVFPLADARAAFERAHSRGYHGKVVLRITA
jgi:NADPH:quinone reductase-like Zn-dependent oxidoreductase